ncbi:hypothetical protein R6258_15770 [Halomonas sp. HP20-15]|uniref:hypothetical protein n=1 Tax=Halomonas sp. HP20-15 TaxID=3085901 RepID=UPI00298205E4|nr:hypothetical protein [Halomonas sp. HP20-15]MDW5378382.1 hypothetical protein [Halomonas sp. HP20-15]
MSMKTAKRISPSLLAALVIGLGLPAFAFADEPIPQASDEATQDAGSQQQAAQSDEQRKRPEGKVKPQEAQKHQDTSLSHDTDEESLDQESGSDAMMQPDGYGG